jgi:hypothetical protein
MGNAGTQDSGSPDMATTDLWKFFEERGTQQKASMYQLVTWIIGFAAVVLGFAVKEGFEGHFATAHPRVLCIFGGVGLVVLGLAFLIIRDHGKHINRTYGRADAARDGERALQKIWEAGKKAESDSLPRICKELLLVVGLFATAFVYLMLHASWTLITHS